MLFFQFGRLALGSSGGMFVSRVPLALIYSVTLGYPGLEIADSYSFSFLFKYLKLKKGEKYLKLVIFVSKQFKYYSCEVYYSL